MLSSLNLEFFKILNSYVIFSGQKPGKFNLTGSIYGSRTVKRIRREPETHQ